VTGPKTDGITDLPALIQVYGDYLHSASFRLQEAANLLVLLPLGAGFQFYFLKRVRHQSHDDSRSVRRLFQRLSALVLAGLLVGVFITVGLICLVLPAIYLAVAYYPFTFLVIVDRRLGVWAGMEASRRAVTRHWWSVLLMVIIAIILLVTGFLAFGIGILVALPVVVGAFSYAYEDLCGGPLKPEAEPVNSALPTA